MHRCSLHLLHRQVSSPGQPHTRILRTQAACGILLEQFQAGPKRGDGQSAAGRRLEDRRPPLRLPCAIGPTSDCALAPLLYNLGWNALEVQDILRVTLSIGSSAVGEQEKHMGMKAAWQLASLEASLGLP